MSDYISREELLEKEKYLSDWNIDLYYIDSDDVKKIPSAEVRPNIHGHWLYNPEQFRSFGNICSECNYDSIARFDFCPKCGADMRGVSE